MTMFFNIKRLSFKHKNNKFTYYLRGYVLDILPKFWSRLQLRGKLNSINKYNRAYIEDRVNYYNKLDGVTELPAESTALADFKRSDWKKTYYLDTHEFTRFFPAHFRICPLYGDITYVPDAPSITKSRPIRGNNANSVILKLSKIRHYMFVNDNRRFEDKKDMLVGRSNAMQEHRVRFLNQYIDNPLCDVGQVNLYRNEHLIRKRLTVDEHLNYKFILCLEGNDVASNLKWVMSSQSIAVMPEPIYETWFMEGRLIPNYHYIRINDDYSDLEERLNYYIQHTDEALEIIRHANEYVLPFRNKKQEALISILVLKKYFEKTGQTL